MPCDLRCGYGVPDSNCTKCICNPGFTGINCLERESDGCSIKCEHGGLPNANCTACDCPAIYIPPFCIEFNYTLSSDEIIEFFSAEFNLLTTTHNYNTTSALDQNQACPVNNHVDLLSRPVDLMGNLVTDAPQILQFSRQYTPINIGDFTYCVPDNIQTFRGNQAFLPEHNFLYTIDDYVELFESRIGSDDKHIFIDDFPLDAANFVENNLQTKRNVISFYSSNYLTMKIPQSTSISDIPLSIPFSLYLDLLPVYNRTNIASKTAWYTLFDVSI